MEAQRVSVELGKDHKLESQVRVTGQGHRSGSHVRVTSQDHKSGSQVKECQEKIGRIKGDHKGSKRVRGIIREC